MTATQTLVPFATAQHLTMDGVSWAFYETVLDELGDGRVRVTFDDGDIEIMSPLPKHDLVGRLVGQLVFSLCLERGIDMVPFGSTTFRDERKRKGLEPDECFYVGMADRGREIAEGFDASLHPPPDLAVEVDITRRSIAREPIYAALGVPELWRVRVGSVACLILRPDGRYEERAASAAFPFLRPADLWEWVVRLRDDGAIATIPAFQAWVRQLV